MTTTTEIRALLAEAERELADGTVTTDIEPLLVEVGPLCDRLDAITSDRDDFSVAMSDLEEDNTTLRDGRDLATQTRDEAQKRSNIDLDRARKAETQRDDAQARCLHAQQIAMECQTEKLAAQVLRAHVKTLREALGVALHTQCRCSEVGPVCIRCRRIDDALTTTKEEG